MTHKLKILPWYFEAVQKGIKNFELRKNDRGFKVGDKLLLQEWTNGKYTGREITRNVDYLLDDCEGLTDGYVIISWERPTGEWIWDGYTSLYCTACKEHIYCPEDPDIPVETRFCPNCGAKMKRH